MGTGERMARSKPRKKQVEKVRVERMTQHLENRIRKQDGNQLGDLFLGIAQDNPPFKKEGRTATEEIDLWFDRDPEAPLIVISIPPDDPPRVQVSINQHGIERELRLRGIGEEHPSWSAARRAAGPILTGLTRRFLADAAAMMARGEIPLGEQSGG